MNSGANHHGTAKLSPADVAKVKRLVVVRGWTGAAKLLGTQKSTLDRIHASGLLTPATAARLTARLAEVAS